MRIRAKRRGGRDFFLLLSLPITSSHGMRNSGGVPGPSLSKTKTPSDLINIVINIAGAARSALSFAKGFYEAEQTNKT